ncbi:hypothetical protein [Methylotuvimicrobium sp. KM1]
MPLSIQALLVSFLLFALSMKPFWMFIALICLAAAFIDGFSRLWR